LKDRLGPHVLIGATTWWPLSARLAIAFLRKGCRVSAVCPPGHPLRFVSGIEAIYTYGSLASMRALRSAIAAAKPDLIVPCDDGVVWQLHSLHRREIELRTVIERSLGPAEHYATIRSRGTLLQTAEQLGIRIPRTQNIGSEAELQSWPQETPGVLKLDGTWGGSGVVIVQSRSEAIAAFRRLATPPSVGWMLKRWLVNRDLLAWWSLQGREKPTVSVQQFITGRPANTMMACWNGQMLALVTVEVLAAQGATGAATVVRIVDNPEIEQAARLLAFRLQLTGFHGLDFVLEEETGAAYLIELNPRSTQLGHLHIAGQGDLASMIAEKLGAKGETGGRSDCGVGDAIAFFPQTFIWNPQSPYLRTAYHDVPWEEPKLVRDLMKIWWPDRQLLSRVYHYFRPPRRPMEVKFDDVTTTALTR
jgi:hypothetical protein